MSAQPDGQGEDAGAQQRAGGDGAHFKGPEPELDEIERQQETDEAVAEGSQTPDPEQSSNVR